MNKLILVLCMVVVLSSFVSALTEQDPDLLGCYNLEGASGNLVDCKDNGLPDYGMNLGDEPLASQQSPISPHTTFSKEFNGVDGQDYYQSPATDLVAAMGYKDITICSWIDQQAGNHYAGGMLYYTGSLWKGNGLADGKCKSWDNSVAIDISYGGNYGFVCINVNSSHVSCYMNGSSTGSTPHTLVASDKGLKASVSGYYNNGVGQQRSIMLGNLDDFSFWNRSLTSSEIMGLYTNGFQEPISVSTPTYQPPTPLDNAANNTNQTINCTTTDQGVSLRYYLNVSLEGGFTDSPYIFNETPDGVNTSSGLVAYYPFNINNTLDYSYFGNDGTLTGATWNATGGVNDTGGFEFDGVDDEINIQNNIIFNVSNVSGMTVSAWINPNNLVLEDGDIISRYLTTGNQRGWALFLNNNVLQFVGCSDGSTCVTDTGATVINSNSGWHFVTGVWNGSELFTYYNGVLDGGAGTSLTTMFNPNADIEMGTSRRSQHFNGSIDEVMIFNRSLSASEINELFLQSAYRYDGVSNFKTFETNFSDGVYTYDCFVQNSSNGLFSNEVSRTLTIDTTLPTITLNPTNSFNTNNVAQISQYLNYLFFNITFADETELFGVLINVTKDGISYFNYTNVSFGTVGNNTFNYTQNVTTGSWPNGVYTINISASDSHTANSISNYDVSNGIRTITFNTQEGNNIKISSDGSAYSTLYNKKEDRYEFGWNYLLTDSNRKFTIESDNLIYYLPNSKYIGHFVIMGKNLNGNWIDFEGIGKDYSVKKINDRKYEITFTNLPLTNQIIAKSLGGVNKVTETYFWYKGNYTTSVPIVSTFGNTETFTLNITRNNTFALPNATLIYDGVEYLPSSTPSEDYIIFSRDLVITQPPGTSENINFTWLVNVTQPLNGSYTFNISSTINISEALIDNCSFYNTTILVISGMDEETDNDVNVTLNIVFIPQVGINNSYELSGSINYSFCSNSDVNFTLDSIMEYGDGTIYTDRKYYLNDFQIDTSNTAEVILYHLNNTKASEIVFTVFDTTTGDRVEGAFIKMLRYYPGENVFRIVEIAKTDETGQSLGKMVLADVFYKFIIEAPAGIVKLDTGTLRILSLTRSFGISFVVDVLDVWDKIHGVNYLTTCTKGTKTCRVTWSDESNIVQSVTLEVWRINGLTDTLLSSQTTEAAAGTISYTVVEDTATNTYEARAFARSTNPSDWSFGRATFFYSDNPFFTDEAHRLASLFPLFLLVLVIIFALIDFGTIGVVIGSLLGLIIGSMVGILPIDPFYLISFILMAIILIYKLSK